MSVLITYNETLTFGGTFDPAFILKIVQSLAIYDLTSYAESYL